MPLDSGTPRENRLPPPDSFLGRREATEAVFRQSRVLAWELDGQPFDSQAQATKTEQSFESTSHACPLTIIRTGFSSYTQRLASDEERWGLRDIVIILGLKIRLGGGQGQGQGTAHVVSLFVTRQFG